jgi:hypothetical protein
MVLLKMVRRSYPDLNAVSYMNLPVDLDMAKDSGVAAAHGSASVAGIPASSKRSLTLELASGGVVDLSVDEEVPL